MAQITGTANPVKTKLRELGDALDLAEGTDPSLRPRDRGAFVRRAPAPWERLSLHSWVPPQHSAVRAYWRELKAAMQQPVYTEYTERDLRRCRRKFERAWQAYDDLTITRDSGFFIGDRPSLRAVLNARAAVIESFTILDQIESRPKYQVAANKRARADKNRQRLLVKRFMKETTPSRGTMRLWEKNI
jgi:hypothetical protein